jgi:diacylglycerol kinase (ATP)
MNPRSGGGATGRRWRGTCERLRAALGAIEVERTRGPRDAERLAREAARAGVARIVVAGGDGTLAEVASGLLGADLASYVEVGLLPCGTGVDFARSLGVPRDLEGAIACLAGGRARPVDALRVTRHVLCGEMRTAYGLNEASFGLSGLVAERLERRRAKLGGRLAFPIGAVAAAMRYRRVSVTIRVDGVLVHDGPLTLCASANGRCFGGGMRIAPEARIDDGILDVVIVAHLSTRRLLAKLPSVYRGTHLADAAVGWHRGRVVEAEAAAGSVPLELDGEFAGALPARIEVVPAALKLIGPAQ